MNLPYLSGLARPNYLVCLDDSGSASLNNLAHFIALAQLTYVDSLTFFVQLSLVVCPIFYIGVYASYYLGRLFFEDF